MFDNITFDADFEPIYVDLGNMLGAFVIDPGHSPFIVLHESLKDKEQEQTAQEVYEALLAFQRSLNPAYFLFPLVKYFEHLPQTALEPVSDNIIIFARAARKWNYHINYPDDYRLIGR